MRNGPTVAPKPAKADNGEKPRKRVRRRLPWIMSREECKALKGLPNTRCASGLRWRAMLEVMHRGGLRVGEVCALRRRDIIWDRNQVEIRQGKGGKDRTVSLDAATMAWLRSWDGRRPRGATFFNAVRKRSIGGRPGSRNRKIVEVLGKPISPRQVQRKVRELAVKAAERGMMDPDRAALVTPHKLRHAYATERIEDGWPLTAVAKAMGHSDIATTGIYLHARPGDLDALAASLAPDLPPPAP